MHDATTRPTPLLTTLLGLVAAHRCAFHQERPYQRCLALVVGHLCALGRHTLTQVLLALGLGQADWSGFYRLLSRPRLDYDHLTRQFLQETLVGLAADQPYVVVISGVEVVHRRRW
jgi:hypothetical protein